MQRRSFLKTLAAFAATAVAGPSLAALAPDDRQELIDQMKTGRVCGKKFLLRRPIVLAVDNLIISDCEFIFDFKEPDDFAIELTGNRVAILNCMMTTGKSPVKSTIDAGKARNCVVMNTIFSGAYSAGNGGVMQGSSAFISGNVNFDS